MSRIIRPGRDAYQESLGDIPNDQRLVAVGNHTRVGVDTVQTLTPPTPGSVIMLQAEVSTIRFTLTSGVLPTATLGFRLLITNEPLTLYLPRASSLRFIGEVAGAFLNYNWLAVLK